MKALAAVVLAVFVTGCASTNSEYYTAVQKTAEANAMASKAKFDALSAIAASGDGQAASAAVMALALTQTQNVAPVPQQSQALQWASILATPVTSLGMMWMQADSAKTMAKYNADVDLARISADATTQQALYGSFVSMGETTATVASNIDYTPFVDGMVSLGVTGMDNLTNLGTAGFDANTAIATAGITGAVDLGTAGITGAVDLGTAGMTNLTTMGTSAIDGLISLDADNNDLYGSVWTSYTQTVENMLLAIPEPVNCTPVIGADGTVTITCQ